MDRGLLTGPKIRFCQIEALVLRSSLSKNQLRIAKQRADRDFVIINIREPCDGRDLLPGILVGCAAVIHFHILCAIVQNNVSVMGAIRRLDKGGKGTVF